ncbi:L,D-transpeptidase family protein [Bradyrhizobium sp.]|uniref:L,D-transpeptidase n=1 Tax=Bradyrhizobium sp. TaxID=376 RepID=UPI0025BA3C93|nr:L,D-transpeptidase family protein [Bradyrhizobium sp.]
MIRVREHGSFAAPVRFWRVAVLTAAGAVGATTQAEATVDYFYGQYYYSTPYYYRQDMPVQRQKPRRRPAVKKDVPAEKATGAKPHGPLIIAISIEKQKLKVYDSNGFFAESPVSTGMKGHSTPMGVFSVIQKHKFHRSNIYSGAPMPYMQRITWSGVAMHAGVLPGYPASHGCIRMPMAFATKMWNWTRMGARVIVTPGELTPENFSHPLLASFKVPPQPAAAAEPEANTHVGAKSDKGSPETRTESANNVVELKPSVGHADLATPANGDAAPSEPREHTRTADAGSDARPAKEPLTMSDAAANNNAPPREGPAARSDSGPMADVEAAKNADNNQTATSDAATAKPAETADAIKKDQGPSEGEKPAAANAAPVDATRKPDPAATATVEARPIAQDAKKDESRLTAGDKPVATKPEPPKRAGQIAVFVSRKDSKLYVRQNFSPLFEVAVTIAPSDRPLGTHVFTAEVDKEDANSLRWSVVSLPLSARYLQRGDQDLQITQRRRVAGAIPPEAKPIPVPDSPAQALDRLAIPADTMARINEMLTSGGSIIVSDQGINQGETGAGTDFIVRLR